MALRIALQLYSIKDEMPDGLEPALAELADCGYNAVEFAGYYDMTARDLRGLCQQYGLEPFSSHVSIDLLENDLDGVAEYSRNLGLEYVICPYADFETMEDVEHVAAVLNKARERLAPLGIRTGYHNHAHEFKTIDGRFIMDLLIERFAAPDMVAEIDTCWTAFAGVDPVRYIDGLGQTAGPIHFKELGAGFAPGSETGLDTTPGEGIIDFKGVFEVMKTNGILDRGIVVEQEGYTDEPYKVLKIAADHIRGLADK